MTPSDPQPAPGPITLFNPRTYRAAYLLALAIIATLVLAGQVFTDLYLSDLEQDSRLINQAGRQRMLYLAISRASLMLHTASEPSLRQRAGQNLAEALQEWRETHQALLGQGPDRVPGGHNTPQARDLLAAMEPARREVLQAAQQLLEQSQDGRPGPPAADLAQTISLRGDLYLRLMDRLTRLYSQQARQRVQNLLGLEWLLTGAVLLALALVGLFIFRPMSRRLMADMEALAGTARAYEQLSLTDGLTGLANRRALDKRLSEEWRRAARQQTSLALLMLDLDHFKNYNDSHGHQAGDRVLRSVALVLAGAVRRPGDLAARYGGEELAALLVGTDQEGALALAEEVRRRVEALGLTHQASPVAPVVTVSLGVAAARPRLGSRPQELVSAADQALYQAKDLGRNQVCCQELDLHG